MPSLRRFCFAFTATLLVCFAPSPGMAQKPAIKITVDLSDVARKLSHTEMEFPVTAGPLILTSAQWIPGTHMPAGQAEAITGVVFTAGGQTIAWRRDDVDLYQFHLTIPQGVTTLHARLDTIVTRRASQKLAAMEWENVMLYPAHTPVRDIPIQPSLIVPAGWGIGTALTPIKAVGYPVPAAGSTTHFEATNVEQLEDSPVITGLYFHEFPLAPTVKPQHFIDVVSDAPEDSNLRPAVLAEIANLVREADALYGSHHYSSYHFLLTMSEIAGGEGLEHGQSSDNGVGEKGFSDDAHQLPDADLLSHEFTHSWNGKYRRPAELYQGDFATPQQGALLWVYEGMTQYLGNVLAARSGLKTAAQYRDVLAITAAELDNTPGREWRPTSDTAVAASILRGGNFPWINWKRGQDYYFEGELLWLDADTLIRKLTQNKKSLDDFERIFLGKGGNTGPLILSYTFDELVQDLNQVAPYDWVTFLHERVDKVNQRADLAGLESGGYKLIYKNKPTASERKIDEAEGVLGHPINCWYSIGLRLANDGSIGDVRWKSAADKARLAPGQKVIAVDGKIFSADGVREAIKKAKDSKEPIRMIVQADSFVSSVEIDYHDGERYPALVRVDGKPAFLDDIVKPLTPPEKAPEEPKKDDE